MLNDKHINYSQEILKAQFKDDGIAGLQSTLTFSKQTARISSNKYLQIIHCRQNHWIVATTIGSYPKVFIYDSIYELVDQATVHTSYNLNATRVAHARATRVIHAYF